MTENHIDHETELRRRLLPHVIGHLNENVVRAAKQAMGELLTDVPHLAEELLRPIFEWSGFWPEQMAKESLGIPTEGEFELEELLDRFENQAPTQRHGRSSGLKETKDCDPALHQNAVGAEEPFPMGICDNDPPNIFSPRGPDPKWELEEALVNDGEVVDHDPNAELRADEAKLESIALPDASQLMSAQTESQTALKNGCMSDEPVPIGVEDVVIQHVASAPKQAAVKPDAIVKSIPENTIVVFQLGERFGVGTLDDECITGLNVIRPADFDNDQITVIASTGWSPEFAFIGVKDNRWVVCRNSDNSFERHLDYESAFVSARQWITRDYSPERIIPVDEFAESIRGHMTIFRQGARWGVGRQTCKVHWGRSDSGHNYVEPIAGWYDSPEIHYRIFEDDETWWIWRCFVGLSNGKWLLHDAYGGLIGAFESCEDALRQAFPDNGEPDPAGVDHGEPDEAFRMSQEPTPVGADSPDSCIELTAADRLSPDLPDVSEQVTSLHGDQDDTEDNGVNTSTSSLAKTRQVADLGDDHDQQ